MTTEQVKDFRQASAPARTAPDVGPATSGITSWLSQFSRFTLKYAVCDYQVNRIFGTTDLCSRRHNWRIVLSMYHFPDSLAFAQSSGPEALLVRRMTDGWWVLTPTSRFHLPQIKSFTTELIVCQTCHNQLSQTRQGPA